jgi:hypothetical protein
LVELIFGKGVIAEYTRSVFGNDPWSAKYLI